MPEIMACENENELLLASAVGPAVLSLECEPSSRLTISAGLPTRKMCGAWAASVLLAFAAGCAVSTSRASSGPAQHLPSADVSDVTMLASKARQHHALQARESKLEEVEQARARDHTARGPALRASSGLENPRGLGLLDKFKKSAGEDESGDEDTASDWKAPKFLKLWEGWPCAPKEEMFFGKCYHACAHITGGNFTVRMDTCTCAKSQAAAQLPGQSATDCLTTNLNSKGLTPVEPELVNCPEKDEELHDGLCYKRCAEMTDGKYPVRTGMNQCSNGRYGGEWNMGIGPCSGFGVGVGQCLPHIPYAFGMGHLMPKAAQNAGVPPLGMVPGELAQELTATASGAAGDSDGSGALSGLAKSAGAAAGGKAKK